MQVNTNFTNVVDFLNNNVVHTDGSKALTGNLDLDGNKVINLLNPTGAQDAVSLDYLNDRYYKCTSGTRPSHSEGLTIYETDTNTLLYSDGAAWVIVSEPPQDWTPTITQGVVVAGTVDGGWYQRANGMVAGGFTWTSSGAGTAGQVVAISTPVTLTDSGTGHGSFRFYDADTTLKHVGQVYTPTTSGIVMSSDGSAATDFGAAPAITIASGDDLRISFVGRYA